MDVRNRLFRCVGGLRGGKRNIALCLDLAKALEATLRLETTSKSPSDSKLLYVQHRKDAERGNAMQLDPKVLYKYHLVAMGF